MQVSSLRRHGFFRWFLSRTIFLQIALCGSWLHDDFEGRNYPVMSFNRWREGRDFAGMADVITRAASWPRRLEMLSAIRMTRSSRVGPCICRSGREEVFEMNLKAKPRPRESWSQGCNLTPTGGGQIVRSFTPFLRRWCRSWIGRRLLLVSNLNRCRNHAGL